MEKSACIQYDAIAIGAVADIFTVIGVIVAVIGFIFAYEEYKKNQLIKRAEFYTKLFETLFKDSAYRKIRDVLDLDGYSDEDIKDLKRSFEKDRSLESEMVDYLNFLEYVVVLEKIKVVKDNDIIDLFDYYLKCLKQNSFAMDYIENYGFENLKRKIDSIKIS